MRLGPLIGPELRQILKENPDQVRDLLEEIHPEDIADVVGELSEADAARIFADLPAEAAAAIFERLEDDTQEAVAEEMGPKSVAVIAAEMAPDDRVEFLDQLDGKLGRDVRTTLEAVDPAAAEEVAALEAWPDATAGRLMTPDFLHVPPSFTAAQVMEHIRAAQDAELVSYVYMLAEDGHLLGVASLRDLILAQPGEAIDSIATRNLISVPPTMDQEKVAERMAKYDVNALPVVGEDGRCLGVITVDDVIDVIQEEQTEDVQKLGAVEPLEDTYFATTFWTFVRKRGTWLLVLFVGEFFTGSALRHFDHVLKAVTSLSFYVPLLVSTGGNSGGQSSSLVIRGMAVGEIQTKDWGRVLVKEASQGVVLGALLAMIGAARVLLWGDGPRFAVVIGVTLVGIVTMGCTVGSMLPIFLKRAGFDPATSSAPFIASLVDVLGILIYFSIAKVMLAKVIAAAM